MRALVADLNETVDRVRLGGGRAARERHLSRGKLLPRDRVRALIDPVSPFLEVGQLAAHGLYGGEVPSAGIWARAHSASAWVSNVSATSGRRLRGGAYPGTTELGGAATAVLTALRRRLTVASHERERATQRPATR